MERIRIQNGTRFPWSFSRSVIQGSLVQTSFVQDRWVNDRRFSIRPAYYDDRIFKCFSSKMYLVNIATTVRLKMTK